MARFTAAVALALSASCHAAGDRDVRQAPQTISLFGTDAAIDKLYDTKAMMEVADDFEAQQGELAALDAGLGDKIAQALSKLQRDQISAKSTLQATLTDSSDKIDEKIEKLEEELESLKNGLAEEVEGKLAELQEFVDDKLSAYQPKMTWANYTWDNKYDDRNYELLSVAKSPENTENGHAGRMMYKVKFNVNNPGFWYPNRDEMFHACRSLSADLEEYDGVDRALKPACDHPSHCDGQGVSLSGSYLSHCGSGGHRRTKDCLGMTDSFLGGSCMYNRENSWNGCQMLRHDGRPNHHHWADCYARSGVQCEHTICTSSNSNWKVAPNGWCDPHDNMECYNF